MKLVNLASLTVPSFSFE